MRGGRRGRGEAEAGISLFAGGGGDVEDGAINLGNDDMVAAAGVEGGGRAEGERIEFRVRE